MSTCNRKISPCIQVLGLLSFKYFISHRIWRSTEKRHLSVFRKKRGDAPWDIFLMFCFIKCLDPKSNMNQQARGRKNPQGLQRKRELFPVCHPAVENAHPSWKLRHEDTELWIQKILSCHTREMQYTCIMFFTSEPANFFLKKKNIDLVDVTFFVESLLFSIPLLIQPSYLINNNNLRNP